MPVPPISTARGTRPPPLPRAPPYAARRRLRRRLRRGRWRPRSRARGGRRDRPSPRRPRAPWRRSSRVPLQCRNRTGSCCRPCVTILITRSRYSDRDVELDELLVEPARELGVDDRAEDSDAEDAAELAARVHGRSSHARLLGPGRSSSTACGHRHERDPEADPGDRERPHERPDARRRRELPVDEQEPHACEHTADHHRHLRPDARRPPAGDRPGDDHRDRQRGEHERDLVAREARDQLQVERGEEEDGEDGEVRRRRRRRSPP